MATSPDENRAHNETNLAPETTGKDWTLTEILQRLIAHHDEYTDVFEGEELTLDMARKRLLQWRDSEVLKAQINMVEYYDQTPTNKDMDWKGLFADNLAELRYEYWKLNQSKEQSK